MKMTYQLKEEFEDFTRRKNKGYFYANPNKNIDPYHKKLYPLEFTGFINGKPVRIILNNSDSTLIENYTFEEFPESESHMKDEVIDYIHQFINKRMD